MAENREKLLEQHPTNQNRAEKMSNFMLFLGLCTIAACIKPEYTSQIIGLVLVIMFILMFTHDKV